MTYELFAKGTCPLQQIHNIGFTDEPSKAKYIGPGSRNYYIIHYVLDGKGYFNQNPVYGGQGFLLYPGQRQHYYPDSENPWKFLWFVMSGDAWQPLFRAYQADAHTQIFSFSCMPAVLETVKKLSSYKNSIINMYELLEIFFALLKHHNPVTENSQYVSQAVSYVNFTTDYIKSHLHISLSVNDITKLLGISQPYLYRIFREQLGKSPKEYITECKLNHAQKLIAETTMSITEIAASAGFQDVLTFSRFFKTKTGIAPSEYRQKF